MANPIQIQPVRALTDNYCYLVFREGHDEALVIDPSVPAPIEAALAELRLKLGLVLNTHHHHDHVGGNSPLVDRYMIPVYCSIYDVGRVPRATRGLKDEETFEFDGIHIETLSIPGHTQGQVAYYVEEAEAVFVGDTMFAMGCGRLLEGTPEQMLNSLRRLMRLPATTRVYFGHEYTEKNAAFSLTVDPGRTEILERAAEAKALTGKRVPAPRLEEERRVNPFLQPESRAIRARLGMAEASDLEVFTELRKRRDTF